MTVPSYHTISYNLSPVNAVLQSLSIGQKDTKTVLFLQPIHCGKGHGYILQRCPFIAVLVYLLCYLYFTPYVYFLQPKQVLFSLYY